MEHVGSICHVIESQIVVKWPAFRICSQSTGKIKRNVEVKSFADYNPPGCKG